ncbi:MAG TPA: hypothetical protein VJ251_23205 [Stellaceae bacterium]|nr:hypothetical protein [Stellaceae bacterium]
MTPLLPKQFWRLASDEPEEGMQHRQSMVPRSNIVAAIGFKIGEESSDVVGAEIGERQFADRATSCLGHEEKEGGFRRGNFEWMPGKTPSRL